MSRRQTLEIRDTSFEDDAKRLAAALQKVPGLTPAPARARDKRWVWILIATAILLAAVGVVLWHARPRFEINGIWIAEMKKANRLPFRVRVDLTGGDGRFTGSVRYPTGDGAIQAGTLERDRLTFFTVHVPQFASEAATIRWTGVIDGNLIRFTDCG